MGKSLKRASLLLLTIMLLSFLSGCEKKELDPNETEVMKLYLTPVPTPTEAPKVNNPAAVITQGAITYVNEYINNGIYVPDRSIEDNQNSEEDVQSYEDSGY